MASTKFQLEETKKPNPRYVLELRTIRAMIQEADRMDEGLSIVLSPQGPASNSMNAMQRIIEIQARDPLYAQRLNMLAVQRHQPQNGFASRVGQNLHLPGMGLPQGQPQHNSPLNQTSVNQIPPQRSITTLHQIFVPSLTAQSNLTQLSPHVSGNGLPFNGALAHIPGVPPQPPPQAPYPPLPLTIQCTILPARSEEQMKAQFAQFSNTADLRQSYPGLVIDSRPVNPWALHRAVFARNGFESVIPQSSR